MRESGGVGKIGNRVLCASCAMNVSASGRGCECGELPGGDEKFGWQVKR